MIAAVSKILLFALFVVFIRYVFATTFLYSCKFTAIGVGIALLVGSVITLLAMGKESNHSVEELISNKLARSNAFAVSAFFGAFIVPVGIVLDLIMNALPVDFGVHML